MDIQAASVGVLVDSAGGLQIGYGTVGKLHLRVSFRLCQGIPAKITAFEANIKGF
jgi:hypothetical protein